ncbi:hypothetical protein [Gracilimonas tropica]|uniref:hypothetical protein n=1 Tax=Gracilimonas tropica TaxID=454600 RepID=UPI0012FCA99D|nr:hypothetical protein [Gracilimonas tropica]
MSIDLHDLIMDYRNLLGFLYGSDNWKKFQQGREQLHADYRHILRAIIFAERKPTYDLLAKAEGIVLSKRPANHATIIHSLDVFEKTVEKKYYVTVNQIREYYERILEAQRKLDEMDPGVFRIDRVEGVVQIHLHLPSGSPSRNFMKGLQKLINKEKEVQHG